MNQEVDWIPLIAGGISLVIGGSLTALGTWWVTWRAFRRSHKKELDDRRLGQIEQLYRVVSETNSLARRLVFYDRYEIIKERKWKPIIKRIDELMREIDLINSIHLHDEQIKGFRNTLRDEILEINIYVAAHAGELTIVNEPDPDAELARIKASRPEALSLFDIKARLIELANDLESRR